MKLTSRRAFLGSASALMAFAALPAVVASTPRGPASGLQELIAAHKAAWDLRQRTLAEVTRIEMLPAYPEIPRIIVGSFSVYDPRPGVTYELQPTYAMTNAQIEQAVLPHQRDPEAWVAKKKAELAKLVQQYHRDLERIGAANAEQAYDDACDREGDARIALIVFRPTSAEEAETKARYLSMAEPAEGRWAGRSEAQTTSELSPHLARIG